MTVMPPKPREIWQEFHWAFFLDTQGLILCMKRFAEALKQGQIAAARTELDTATEIMRASGAAMNLAGSFTREDYETDVRLSMAPPNVASEGFSGLMSWEHGVLVNLWRSLRPLFADLPPALIPAHERFAAAYKSMADGHVNVCARFVGDNAKSLRYEDRDALRSLRRFGQVRLSSIAPDTANEEAAS